MLLLELLAWEDLDELCAFVEKALHLPAADLLRHPSVLGGRGNSGYPRRSHHGRPAGRSVGSSGAPRGVGDGGGGAIGVGAGVGVTGRAPEGCAAVFRRRVAAAFFAAVDLLRDVVFRAVVFLRVAVFRAAVFFRAVVLFLAVVFLRPAVFRAADFFRVVLRLAGGIPSPPFSVRRVKENS